MYNNLENYQKFNISIGDWTEDYYMVDTTAPKSYDGFGTFTIHEFVGNGKKEQYKRHVFVPAEHLGWQLGRYGSGMYTSEVREEIDGLVGDHIEKTLITRIRKEG